MTLRPRPAMLKGVCQEEMPFNDPHTAEPALWALRRYTADEYEVSVAPIEGDTARRKSLEAAVISLRRLEYGRSPTVNFGRMPVSIFRKMLINGNVCHARVLDGLLAEHDRFDPAGILLSRLGRRQTRLVIPSRSVSGQVTGTIVAPPAPY